jgi:thioredoxin-like negative regulator of GroEL
MKDIIVMRFLSFIVLLLTSLATVAGANAQANAAGNAAPSTNAQPGAQEPVAQSLEIHWVKNLDQINQEAKDSSKLILAYFYATWCPYCKQMERNAWVDPGVALITDEFVACRFDGDKNPDLAADYKVTGYPGLIISDASGATLDRIMGAVDTGTFSYWLAQQLGKHSLQRLEKAAADKPTDVHAQAMLAIAYAGKGDIDEAETYYAKVAQLDAKDTQHYSVPMNRVLAEAIYHDHADIMKYLPKLYAHLTSLLPNLTDPAEIVQAHVKLAFAYFYADQWSQATAEIENLLANGGSQLGASQRSWLAGLLQQAKAHTGAK